MIFLTKMYAVIFRDKRRVENSDFYIKNHNNCQNGSRLSSFLNIVDPGVYDSDSEQARIHGGGGTYPLPPRMSKKKGQKLYCNKFL
jgi:hypothetical protein